MRDTTATHTHTHKGAGMARGPALILGTILSAIGLALFLKNGVTPTGGFPDGDINGPTLLGVETNGWTAWITTAAGALLLLGAAQHLFAKAMSLIVGLALLAAAVIGLIDGDVLGIAATNHWTELGWAVAGVLLLLNLFAPRQRHRDRDRDVVDHDVRDRHVTRDERTVTPVPRTADTTTTREPVVGETVRRDETHVRGEHLRDEDLNRRDLGAETERTDAVHVGDRNADGIVDRDDTGRGSGRFRRD